MALDDLQSSKAREFRKNKLMKGKDNLQFTMDQHLLMEAAAEPVADGTIQTRRGWAVKEGVIGPTKYV